MKLQLVKSTFFGKSVFRTYILSISLLVLLIGGLGFAFLDITTSSTYVQSNPVGSTKVNTSVDANGSAVIEIPIQAPPGTHGIEPKLKLVYNNVLGNGNLGLGWTIQGLSSIERVGATLAQDGFISSVNYSGTDRLLLDGQRLILTGGSAYGYTNSQYHTEIESWRKVVCNANFNSHSDASFTVYSPNGTKEYYGTTGNSRIYAQGLTKSRVWALNKVEDLHGNYMTISYQNNGATDGSYYPLEIHYTGNSNTGSATKRSVKFEWENRPDVVTTYIGGSMITQNQRLSHIKTYLNGNLIKKYKIEYKTSSTTSRSLVHKITESDGQGTALPFTSFSLQEGSNQLATDTKWGTRSNSVGDDGSNQWLADMNGDGMTDYVYNANGTRDYRVMLSQGNTLGTDTKWGTRSNSVGNDGSNQWLVDMNGDGMADYVYNANGTRDYRVMLSQGNALGTDTKWGTRSNSVGDDGANQWFADVNGDGMTDYIYNKSGSGDYRVMLSQGNTFGTDTKWGTRSNSVDNNGARQWFADMNGDGMADYIYQKSGSRDYHVMLSQGNAFGTDTKWGTRSNSVGNDGINQWFSDVNGDGIADYIYNANGTRDYRVMLSQGNALGTDTKWGTRSNSVGGDGANQWLIDMNGDGMSDYVYNAKGTRDYRVMLSQGNTFGNDTKWGTRSNSVGDDGTNQWFSDVNGDGMTDYIYNKAGSRDYRMMLNDGSYPDLLLSVTNGIGGKISFDYSYLADPSVYNQGGINGNYPSADAPGYVLDLGKQSTYISDLLGGSRYVVKNLYMQNTSSNNHSYNYSYSYYYQGAQIDHHGRGFLGFATKEVTDNQMGTKQVEQYNQDFPFVGTLQAVTVMCQNSDDPNCSNGMILHQKQTKYYCLDGPCTTTDQQKFISTHTEKNGSVDTVYRVLKYKEIDNYYTYDTFNYGIANTYQYDNYGNPTQKAYLGYQDSNGNDLSSNDNVYHTIGYYNNTGSGNWLIGFETSSSKSSDAAGNNLISKTSKQYDYPSQPQGTTCVDGWSYQGTMDVICESNWVDDDNNGGENYWINSQKRYDSYGNVTLNIGPANDSTLIAYETTYNTFPQQKTLPRNQQGVSMFETYTYDAGFGVKTSTSDLNGFTNTDVLDGFGRVVAKIGPNAQDLTAPADTLETVHYYISNGEQYKSTHTLRGWGSHTYHTVHEYFDGLGRIYRKKSKADNDAKDVYVDYQFINPKKVKRESLPYFNNDPIYWKTIDYDSYERIRQLTEPDPNDPDEQEIVTDMAYFNTDSVQKTTYSSATPSQKAIDVTVHRWYNGELQTDKLIYPQESNATTIYRYDRVGRPTYVRDADGVEDSIVWNSISAKLKFIETNMGTTKYKYYTTGQLKHFVDAKNQQQTFKYDLLGRKSTQILKDSTGQEVKQITFVFDVNFSDTSNSQGKLSHVKVLKGNETESSYKYGYSPYGYLNMEKLTFNNEDYITRMAYSPSGSKTHDIYPDSSVLNIQRGDQGKLKSIILKNYNTSDQVSAYYDNYNAMGKVGLLSYGNGTMTNYQYLVDGLLDNVQLSKNTSVLMKHHFEWNYLKELQTIQDKHVDSIDYTQVFTYTNHRLTKAVGAQTYGTINYGYSNGGNMTCIGETHYTYNGHQVKSANGFSATYDVNGNMTNKTANGQSYRYVYDTQNRLTAVYKNGSGQPEETYIYDYLGRRLQKTDNGSSTVTYVSKGYEISQDGNNTTTTKYVLGPGGHIGSMTITHSSVSIKYFHHDQINSTNMVTDDQGEVISQLLYKPYGELYASLSYGEDDVRFKYGDKELDDTGLYYFNARYYDPSIGRFITADTRLGAGLFIQDTFNRYAYGLNDPIDYVDPSGHKTKKWYEGQNMAIVGLVASEFMIFAGAILIAATPVCGPGCAIVGAALIGAGVAGAAYALGALLTNPDSFSLVIWFGASLGGALVGAAGPVLEAFLVADAAAAVTEAVYVKFATTLLAAELGVGVLSGLKVADYQHDKKEENNTPSDCNCSNEDPNSGIRNANKRSKKEEKQKAAFVNEVSLPNPHR